MALRRVRVILGLVQDLKELFKSLLTIFRMIRPKAPTGALIRKPSNPQPGKLVTANSSRPAKKGPPSSPLSSIERIKQLASSLCAVGLGFVIGLFLVSVGAKDSESAKLCKVSWIWIPSVVLLALLKVPRIGKWAGPIMKGHPGAFAFGILCGVFYCHFWIAQQPEW